MPNATTQRDWDLMEVEAVVNRIKENRPHLVSCEAANNAWSRLMAGCMQAKHDYVREAADRC